MPASVAQNELLSTVESLAVEIARAAPDCAEKAMQIVRLVRDLNIEPDRLSIQDAIESKLLDSEMSEPQLQATTSAVISAVRNAS
jgi:hypothetical protein